MVSRLEWFFDLRPGDLRRGIFLTLYYFLIISTYTEGQVVRDALFLGHFKAVQLPYVDFAVAAIIGGILALYIRIGRLTSLTNLLAGTLSVCLANVVAFWWVAHLEKPTWLYPVVYIWVGIFGVLAVSQVEVQRFVAGDRRDGGPHDGYLSGEFGLDNNVLSIVLKYFSGDPIAVL